MKGKGTRMREVDLARPLTALPRMARNLHVTLNEMSWGWRLIYALGFALAAGLIYYKTILVWGTVNPLFVHLYTRPYPPPYLAHQYPHGGAIGDPPPTWRPKSRVVVSMTTMPHHVHLLAPTLDSLLRQSLRPDAIYLNLPEGRNPRSNMSYDEAIEAHGVMFPAGVKVHRCQDVGPLTKLLPAVEAEQELERKQNKKEGESSTIIITVDDDQVYPPDTVKYLAWYALSWRERTAHR